MDGSEGDDRLLPLCLLRYSHQGPAGQLTVSPAHLPLVTVITQFSQPALLRKKMAGRKDRSTDKYLEGGKFSGRKGRERRRTKGLLSVASV